LGERCTGSRKKECPILKGDEKVRKAVQTIGGAIQKRDKTKLGDTEGGWAYWRMMEAAIKKRKKTITILSQKKKNMEEKKRVTLCQLPGGKKKKKKKTIHQTGVKKSKSMTAKSSKARSLPPQRQGEENTNEGGRGIKLQTRHPRPKRMSGRNGVLEIK